MHILPQKIFINQNKQWKFSNNRNPKMLSVRGSSCLTKYASGKFSKWWRLRAQCLQYFVKENPRLCRNIEYMYDIDMMARAHLFCFSPPAVSEVWRVWCIWQHWQHPHSVCASLSPFVSRYFHIHMIARHSPKWAFCKGQHLLNIPEYKTF